MAQHDFKPNCSFSSESDGIYDTNSGEKQKQEPKKPPISPPKSATKPQALVLSSSETGESSSDTDFDSDSRPKMSAVVDPYVKRMSSIPMERRVKTDGSKMISTPSPAMRKAMRKEMRKLLPPAPTENEIDAKKAKQNTANGEPKKALIAPNKSANKLQTPDLSSSESDSDTDSDSCSPPKRSDVFNLNRKPISLMPMRSKLIKKVGSRMISTTRPATRKRPPPAPTANENDAKKAKLNTAIGEPKKALIAPCKSTNKLQAPDLSSSESDSDTDTDSDSFLPPKKPTAADPNIKPNWNTANGEPKNASIAPSKSANKVQTPDLSSSESDSESDSDSVSDLPPRKSTVKKYASKTFTALCRAKRGQFHRLWSEDDEIVILKGMIDYKNEKNGQNPIADTGEFHEYIKKSLHVDVSRSQLMDKVRRLKQKYANNASWEKGYELSKLIWGSESQSQSQNDGNSDAIAVGTSTDAAAASLLKLKEVDDKQKSMKVEKKIDLSGFVQYGGTSDFPILPEEAVKAGMELVDDCRRAELGEKWRKLREQEIVVYVNRMELLKEQALVALEAIRSSGN